LLRIEVPLPPPVEPDAVRSHAPILGPDADT
jgi:hypothetical protein